MAFTLVQAGGPATGTGSVTCTLPAASTAGTLLVATVENSGGTAFSAPTGWVSAVGVGGTVRSTIFYYAGNPGGITSAVFTGTANCRGSITEFSTAAGMTQVLNATGTANT